MNYVVARNTCNSGEELSHHGVKGMKWGVRRYQNKDGSLTGFGKRKFKKVEKNEKLRKKHTESAKWFLESNADHNRALAKEHKENARFLRDVGDIKGANEMTTQGKSLYRSQKCMNRLLKVLTMEPLKLDVILLLLMVNTLGMLMM